MILELVGQIKQSKNENYNEEGHVTFVDSEGDKSDNNDGNHDNKSNGILAQGATDL